MNRFTPSLKGEDVGAPGLGSTSLSLAVPMRVYITAARSPPRSEPAISQDLRPRKMPRGALSVDFEDTFAMLHALGVQYRFAPDP